MAATMKPTRHASMTRRRCAIFARAKLLGSLNTTSRTAPEPWRRLKLQRQGPLSSTQVRGSANGVGRVPFSLNLARVIDERSPVGEGRAAPIRESSSSTGASSTGRDGRHRRFSNGGSACRRFRSFRSEEWFSCRCAAERLKFDNRRWPAASRATTHTTPRSVLDRGAAASSRCRGGG